MTRFLAKKQKVYSSNIVCVWLRVVAARKGGSIELDFMSSHCTKHSQAALHKPCMLILTVGDKIAIVTSITVNHKVMEQWTDQSNRATSGMRNSDLMPRQA